MTITTEGQESYVSSLLYGWSWTGTAWQPSGETVVITYNFDITNLHINNLYGNAATNEAIIPAELREDFEAAASVWESFADICTPSAQVGQNALTC